MTKNQKIALGCGGLGCFGLIVVVVVCAGFYIYTLQKGPAFSSNRPGSYSSNINRSSNSNSNINSNSNSSTASTTSMSDDDKHKLFQAASMTQDAEVVNRVGKRVGLLNDDDSPSDEYAGFVKDHILWAFKNGDFIKSVSTPETAKAYVEAHISD
jgi:hypothetical protein